MVYRIVAIALLLSFWTKATHAQPVTDITAIPNGFSYWIRSSGTYRLANDINWQGGPLGLTPFLITANNVTLNLNGKTIRAVGSAGNPYNTTGISAYGCNRLVVSNGVLQGFREYGITVTESQDVALSRITVRDIHNPTLVPITNSPPNAAAGIAFLLSTNVTVSDSTIANISGGPQVMMVAGLQALATPGLTVNRTTVTAISSRPETGLNDNLCNGIAVINSPDAVLSDILISNVVGIRFTATVNGLVADESANFQLTGRTNMITAITNFGAVAAGISGTTPKGMAIRNTRISDVFTGETWTNNLIGHTSLGMVFGPLGGYPLGFRGVTVTNGGRGYTSAPTVIITNVPNDQGSGATARAFVSGGQVTRVQILSPGSNFLTFPSITFRGGGGRGAAAIVLPSQVIYDRTNTNTGGGVFVTNCLVENITGSIDDAHGISFFGVTNVVASNILIRHVRDGSNSLGIGGSKATGIENFGNPMVADSRITLIRCRAENIRAHSPGDLAANGFSLAGGGIRLISCTASNVRVTGTNRLTPGASPGLGYGFGYAPDIRLNYQYPAWNAVLQDCSAADCDVGFDTFNYQNSVWIRPVSSRNRLEFLIQPSNPGLPSGTVRMFYGSVWNQIYEATNYTKAVPVWNNATGNRIIPAPTPPLPPRYIPPHAW